VNNAELLRDAYISIATALTNLAGDLRSGAIDGGKPGDPMTAEMLRRMSLLNNLWNALYRAEKSGDPDRILEVLSRINDDLSTGQA
jgi:hypothetical protein